MARPELVVSDWSCYLQVVIIWNVDPGKNNPSNIPSQQQNLASNGNFSGQIINPVIKSQAPKPANSYRELLEVALISAGFAYLALIPFAIAISAISIANFVDPVSATEAAWDRALADASTVAMALTGSFIFMRKSGLKSGFVIFILAAMGAFVPMEVLLYSSLQKNLRGILASLAVVLVFGALIIILTRVSMSKFRALIFALIAIPIVFGSSATAIYYSKNGYKIIKARQTNVDTNKVARLNYLLYSPASDIWQLHYATTDSENCHPDILELSVVGSTNIQIYEGLDKEVIYSNFPQCSKNGDKIVPSLVGKTPNGHSIYADTYNFKDGPYGWVATQIGNTYLAINDNNGDNHPLDFYSQFIDNLKPLSKTVIESIGSPTQ